MKLLSVRWWQRYFSIRARLKQQYGFNRVPPTEAAAELDVSVSTLYRRRRTGTDALKWGPGGVEQEALAEALAHRAVAKERARRAVDRS